MISVRNVDKSFDGVHAVQDLSFEVASGEVFGLLGPNGAGKTTTLRILATLLAPDAGSATVAGHDIVKDGEAVRAAIGVVNGGMGLYDRLNGREILHYFGRLYGMTTAAIDRRVRELDELLDLGDTLTRRAGGFSSGMKQKIVVARAVLHDPPVIFFDEATSGLDVVARRALLDFVRAYPTEGRAVIYSTHVMSEVEALCDRACIIFRGRKIAEDTIAGLSEAADGKGLEEAFFRLVERSGLRSEEVAA